VSRLIFILGNPGSGKSSGLRNLKKTDVNYISVSGKELPFVPDFTPVVAKSINEITALATKAKKPIVVVDDLNYVFNNETHSAKNEKDQWVVYRKIKDDFFELINTITSKDTDQNFYLLAHLEPNDQNLVIMKTAGSAVRKDITPEGYSNIVLEAINDLGDFVFKVKSDGNGVKSPFFGDKPMFDTPTVANDIKLVNDKINAYYGKKETK